MLTSKRQRSRSPLPEPKRQHVNDETTPARRIKPNFDLSLTDEVVLVIFSHLSWTDLCAIQPTNRHWARLATDNQLWKLLYIREFERLRLRGSRGFVNRRDGRQIRPLPHSNVVTTIDNLDWKWMFRISSNWKRGRSELEEIRPLDTGIHLEAEKTAQHCTLLTGAIAVSTQGRTALNPSVTLDIRHQPSFNLLGRHEGNEQTCVCAIALDQSRPLKGGDASRLAIFYGTGEFSICSIDSANVRNSRRLLSYLPRIKSSRTTNIRQAVYHHPLLVTLSETFHLSLYDLSDAFDVHGLPGQGARIRHTQTLTSFSSFPPTSMVLTPGPRWYRLVLAFAAPVYPAHWGVAATVLTVSHGRSQGFIPLSDNSSDYEDRQQPCTVIRSRTVRSFDVPASSGWLDEYVLRTMKEQWGRKVARVADVKTDGKWLVLAADSSLQVYRLYLPSSSLTLGSSIASGILGRTSLLDGVQTPNGPRITFVRMLHGHKGRVITSAVSDGRCVTLSDDGSIWVWDLEEGWSTEVQAATSKHMVGVHGPMASIAFDDRRIVVTGSSGLEIYRFDV